MVTQAGRHHPLEAVAVHLATEMAAARTLGDGRYIVGRELGRGAMGVVYEAEDTVLARTVAVKTIDLAFAAGDEARKEFEQRFFTEARVAARLSHPGIVVCHDVGKDPASGELFIVFEYLQGRTLADRVAEGPMAWRDALAVVVQVARAIHHAHEHGVVHRDLKPANIMLLHPRESAGSAARGGAPVKIMDFGVARLESIGPRLTGPGQSFGSPLYTSPEQVLGGASSARSDIFSLGSVLCTLLLGRPWFAAPSIPEIVARVVHADPPRLSSLRPDAPAALDVVVAAALAKREHDRYATAADMADDLEEVLAGGTPRHAAAAAPSLPPVSTEDPLLEGLAAPARGPARGSAADASGALTSLLEEATATIPGRRTRPGAPSTAASAAARRWLAPAGALIALALLPAAVFLSWPRRSPPAADPGGSVAPVETAVVGALPAPKTISPSVFAGPVASPVAPSAAPATVATAPAAAARRASAAAPPARERPPAGMAATVIEQPATDASSADQTSSVTSPEPVPRTRMRVAVEHPFENGRLIVWIDGVLVFEAKLQAPVSRKIIAIKVREGRLGTLLDVEPGPHEVRVEVTWGQERRGATKVVDVAPGATGLLDVRVGRMSKEVTLQWSRLAKE